MAESPKAWGYLGWWLPQSWRSAPLKELDRVLFFDLKVNADGSIADRHGWPDDWGDLQKALQQSRTPLDLTLTLFEPDDFNQLFSSVAAIRQLSDEAIALVRPASVAGLQLDFEIYDTAQPQAIENFRTFLRMLSNQLQQMTPRKNLSVFLPVSAQPPLYDSDSLGLVDHVVVQGYDVHWRQGKVAGPVAPLGGEDIWTWEKMVRHGESAGAAKAKMLLGFPLFGYEWPVKGNKLRSAALGVGSTTSFAPLATDLRGEMRVSVQERVQQYGATHDPLSGSSHYQFKQSDGQFIEGWFEDWWALSRKIDFLKKEELGGIAFFLIGYDGGQLVNHFLHERGARINPSTP